MPDGMGRGLLAADAEPPPGAVTYARPTWQIGQTFVLVRGDVVGAQFVVEAKDAGGYVVRGPGGACGLTWTSAISASGSRRATNHCTCCRPPTCASTGRSGSARGVEL